MNSMEINSLLNSKIYVHNILKLLSLCCTTLFFLSLSSYCTAFLPRIRSRIIINGRGDVFIYGAHRLNRERKKAATQVGKTNFKGKQKASQSFSIDVFIRSDLNTFSCMSVFFSLSLFRSFCHVFK